MNPAGGSSATQASKLPLLAPQNTFFRQKCLVSFSVKDQNRFFFFLIECHDFYRNSERLIFFLIHLPPLRQAGKVWQGRGSPTRGNALNPRPLSAPAKDSVWPRARLPAPPKWTGIPEGPPREPRPSSSLSIRNRASALPFQARPSSSVEG